MMSKYHQPVLLRESVEELVQNKNGVYVDVTFGGGGHSREILKMLSAEGRLIAFDQDADAKQNLIEDQRFEFVESNFKYMKNFLKSLNRMPVDGVLADLGVSSHQFDEAERGFSFRYSAPLDMRMNTALNETAADVLEHRSEQELNFIFRAYGEFKFSKALVREVLKERELNGVKTTDQLVDLVKRVVAERNLKGELPKVFQALRLEVNKELEVLKDFLRQSLQVLKSKGRLVVISYHSLEDRLVKNFMRSGNLEGRQEKDFYGNLLRPIKPIYSKAIVPTGQEISVNPRARSAKMRVAELV